MNLDVYALMVETELKAASRDERIRRRYEAKRALASRKADRRWSIRPFCGRMLIRIGTHLAGTRDAPVPAIPVPASAK